ncbi:substrate-binding domain-containing protein [Methylocaldum sp.]|uniref:substrate-binding domain-containing protein n=1 Tax=Methylocaldum sp. TaxID=1969727 RepID=UPI002D6BEB1F|nr:substrate-binding domain-containing protein [Methylocaldum sp.]HYE36045.1 substrate-binding domain-containing protein [Methylocaldum sp.]
MTVRCNRRWAALLFASLLMPFSVAQADNEAFKVCADPNNPPFSDKSGQGFENKIAELFAKELGKKVEYTWFPQRIGFIRNTLKAQLPNSDEYKCDVVMGVPTGYELAATTKPYYRSTYALVYRKNRGWDDIKSPDDLERLPSERKSKLRIAMFDGAPGTTWLFNHQLADQGVPYQSMTGDAAVNTAQILEKDFSEGKIDMVIVWGPIAGYLATRSKGTFELIPMKSEESVKFDFPISMGVRFPDKERKEALNSLIDRNAEKIRALLSDYRVPLVDQDGNLIETASKGKK